MGSLLNSLGRLNIEERKNCKGVLGDGRPCTSPAKANGYCGYHQSQHPTIAKKVAKAKREAKKAPPTIRQSGKLRATGCQTPCDHPNRMYPRKQLPCNRQHGRRLASARGSGEINDPLIRAQVLKMNNGHCIMGSGYNSKCAGRLSSATLEVDHIHPFSRGGYDGLKNWGPICRSCNAKKNNYAMATECTNNNGDWICDMAPPKIAGDKGFGSKTMDINTLSPTQTYAVSM
eukprot:g161.t1